MIVVDCNDFPRRKLIYLAHVDPLAPHVVLYLQKRGDTAFKVASPYPDNIKEIDINGWRIGPQLARQYAAAILLACDIAEGKTVEQGACNEKPEGIAQFEEAIEGLNNEPSEMR